MGWSAAFTPEQLGYKKGTKSHFMELHTIGIDLGKTVFHLVGLDSRGQVLVRRNFSRTQLLRFTANRPICLVGMEACGGSHFLGRVLREQGHDVRLMPAQYVKPYVKSNKNDFIDAEAIAPRTRSWPPS
jgi:transposase